MTAEIQVALLGPLEVTVDGKRIPVAGKGPRTLVAALALAAGRPVSMEALADYVWSDAPPADVRGSLYTVIRRLRRLLGADVVTAGPGSYRLRIAPDRIDVQRFRALVARARDTDDATLLDRALALWRGDPLEDVPSDRLRAEHAPRLTEEWVHATERRIDLLLAAGQHAELVGELRTITARHPLRESLWALLITALYRSGRQPEALEAYDSLRRRLRDQLGLDPGGALQQLHHQVLVRDQALDAVPATGTAPAGTAPVDGPSRSRALPVRPRELPSDIDRFTGRERELAALDALLPSGEDPAPPVVIAAVDGAGGIGKTTLAVHWAHRVADSFPDGQLYVNLRGFGPGEPISATGALEILLRSLGIAPERIPTGLDSRSALLRTTLAGRKLLVLLDNARSAEQVRPLVPGSGSLVLVTSRNQLRSLAARDGAHRVTLDHLTEPESTALVGQVYGADRVAAERDAATELARLCDHLPLPLVIAAERATRQPGSTLRDVVEELRDERDRLDALNSGEDTATDTRAVFSWSYRALGDDAARMFRLLGTAPGGDLTADAAAALAGTTTPRARRLLDALVDAHQVQQKHHGRYELHDLLRAYAAELARHHDTDAERTEAVRRLLDWYMRTAWGARLLLHPSTSAADPEPAADGLTPLVFTTDRDAVRWYESERANLIAAAQAAYDGGHDELCWRLALAFWAYLHMCQAWDALIDVHRIAHAATRRLGDRRNEAEILTGMGSSYRGRGDLAQALAHHRRSLAIFRELGDAVGTATALSNLGASCRDLGDLESSLRYLKECHALDEAAGEPGNLAVSLHQLALTYIQLGRGEAAIDAASRAYATTVALGHRPGEGKMLQTLARAYALTSDTDRVLDCYRNAIALYADLGDRWSQAECLGQLGRTLRGTGDRTGAEAAFREALGILDALGGSGVRELRADLAAL